MAQTRCCHADGAWSQGVLLGLQGRVCIDHQYRHLSGGEAYLVPAWLPKLEKRLLACTGSAGFIIIPMPLECLIICHACYNVRILHHALWGQTEHMVTCLASLVEAAHSNAYALWP